MATHTIQQRDEPRVDIIAQLDDAMAAVTRANEVFSTFELVLHSGDMEKAAELVDVQRNAYSAMTHVLQSIRGMVEFLHTSNKKLEMDIHRMNSELVEMSLNLLRKQKLLDDFVAQASLILQAPTDDKNFQLESLKRVLTVDTNHEFDWNSFQKQFTKVNPKFIQELFRQCPTLTPTEVKVSCLMKIGLSTKEIMQLMRVTIRDVETHRYKIRKKLRLPTKVNLVTYLSGLHTDGY